MKKQWNAPQVEELEISATSMPGHGGPITHPHHPHHPHHPTHPNPPMHPTHPTHPARPIPPVEDEEGTDELS